LLRFARNDKTVIARPQAEAVIAKPKGLKQSRTGLLRFARNDVFVIARPQAEAVIAKPKGLKQSSNAESLLRFARNDR